MTSPPTLDIEPLLAPIPGANPSGVPLAYAPEYDQIREARRCDDDLNQGAWARERKVADWDFVVDLASSCLATRTKDLQIASWLTEALAKLHGFAGLRDGLTVLGAIQARFWDTYYPEIDDGDVESRFGPFLFLNDRIKGLPFLIRTTPITQGIDDQNYHALLHQQSREVDNLMLQDESRAKKLIASGRIEGKTFDDAVAQTPKAFYARSVADLKAARAALAAFESSTDRLFGRDAPSLIEVTKAIDEVARLLDPILAAKRQAEPDPEPESETETGAETEPPPPPAEGVSAPVGPITDGAIAFDGVAVPKRRARLGTPQEGESADFGRVLIDFKDRAQALAEAGVKLDENRRKYAEMLAELKRLDDEYEDLSQVVSRDKEAYQLLARLLKRP